MSFSRYPSLQIMLVMGMHWDFSFLDFGGFLAYGKCGWKKTNGKVESSLIAIAKFWWKVGFLWGESHRMLK